MAKRLIKRASGNKKVLNATPLTVDDIKFKSKLEVYTYRRLREEGFNFSYEAKSWIIQEKFEYIGEKIRPITIKPDFVDFEKRIIIEVKGFATDIYTLRLKMFKRFLSVNKCEYKIYHVKNQKQVEELITQLKQNV